MPYSIDWSCETLQGCALLKSYAESSQSTHFPIAPYLVVRAKPGMQRWVMGRLKSVLVRQAAPGTPIEISLLIESVNDLAGQWVRSARLLTLFAGLASLVTFVGVYGSTAYQLLRRRREFGIRLALGARSAQLTRGVVKTGLRWSLYGLSLGSLGAVWVALTVRAMLFETVPWDAGSLLASIAAVLAIGGLAAWAGARRAALRDPMFLLRSND